MILLLTEVLGLFALFWLLGLVGLLVLQGSLKLSVYFVPSRIFTVIRVSLAPV